MNPNQIAAALQSVIDGADGNGIRFEVIERIGGLLEVEARWGDDDDHRFQLIIQSGA